MKKIILGLFVLIIVLQKTYSLDEINYEVNGILKYDNNILYCINICENNKITNIKEEKFDVTKINKIKEYIYFGYNYKLQTDIKYYYATQSLIWETIYDKSIILKSNNEYIDVTNEKNAILNNIKYYYLKPSFAEKTIVGEYKSKKEIIDENNILSDFKLNSEFVEKDNNKLIVNYDWLGLKSITLSKTYNESKTKYYVDDNNKYIYSVGINSFLTSVNLKSLIDKYSFRINVIGEKYDIKRQQQENGNIDNIVYSIYAKDDIRDIYNNIIYTKDSEVQEIKSNTEIFLNIGKYYLKEKINVEGYKNDKETYEFEIKDKKIELNIQKQIQIINVTLESDNDVYKLYYNDEYLIDIDKININLIYGKYEIKKDNVSKQIEIKENTNHFLILKNDKDFTVNLLLEKKILETKTMPNTFDNFKYIEMLILLFLVSGLIIRYE